MCLIFWGSPGTAKGAGRHGEKRREQTSLCSASLGSASSKSPVGAETTRPSHRSHGSRCLLTHSRQPVLQHRTMLLLWRHSQSSGATRAQPSLCSAGLLRFRTGYDRLVFSTAFRRVREADQTRALTAIKCCHRTRQPRRGLQNRASKRRRLTCSLIVAGGPTGIQVRQHTCRQSTA